MSDSPSRGARWNRFFRFRAPLWIIGLCGVSPYGCISNFFAARFFDVDNCGNFPFKAKNLETPVKSASVKGQSTWEKGSLP
ncbi:hypothetical protein ACFOHS_05215 [Jhaorihella thermophila]